MMELNEFYQDLKKCEKCELTRLEVNKKKLLPRIGKKPYLIVSQNPSYYRDPSSTHIWGGLNNLPLERFEKFLIKNGLLIDDFTITNIIKCSFKANVVPANFRSIRKVCSYWFEREVKAIRPKFIMALGNIASDFFKLKSGEMGQWNFIPVVANVHPSFVARFGKYEEFFNNFEKVFRWL